MKPFTYERANSVEAAAKAAASVQGPRFIARGSNLLDLMKLQIETPTHLIDVNRLGLDRIEKTEEGGLRIGAPALTSRGLNEADFVQVADFLDRGIVLAAELKKAVPGKLKDFNAAMEHPENFDGIMQLRSEVEAFASAFHMPSFVHEKLQ